MSRSSESSMRRERELEVGENDKKPLTVELLNLLRNLVEAIFSLSLAN